MVLFQRSFVQSQPLGYSFNRFLLSNNTLCDILVHQRKAIVCIAEYHVSGNARFLRDYVDHMLGFYHQSLRFIYFNLYRRGVQPADSFVGQVQVPNVFRSHFQSHVDCVV